MMTEKETAKNILLDKVCNICCFRIKNQKPVEDTCKKTVPFGFLPDERTCELFWAWEDEFK